MKTRIAYLSSVCTCAIFAGACGGDGGSSGVDARVLNDGDGRFPTQIVTSACAPNDAPALRLLFGDVSLDGECRAIAGFGQSVEILLWVGDIDAPAIIEFIAPNLPANGVGTYCGANPAPCEITENGTVAFDTFERNVGSVGSFVLRALPIQTDVQGSFDATWCTPATPVTCG